MFRARGSLLGAFVAIRCSSCGGGARPDPRGYLPDPMVARKAVESTLEAWHQSPHLVTTACRLRSIVFVDQQRRPGQPLVSFAVLSESESEGYRRFQVKLSLAE